MADGMGKGGEGEAGRQAGGQAGRQAGRKEATFSLF